MFNCFAIFNCNIINLLFLSDSNILNYLIHISKKCKNKYLHIVAYFYTRLNALVVFKPCKIGLYIFSRLESITETNTKGLPFFVTISIRAAFKVFSSIVMVFFYSLWNSPGILSFDCFSIGLFGVDVHITVFLFKFFFWRRSVWRIRSRGSGWHVVLNSTHDFL